MPYPRSSNNHRDCTQDSDRSLRQGTGFGYCIFDHTYGENGKKHGGEFYKRGALYKLLQNRLYRGEIDYKDNIYPGQHKAIVFKPLWDAVQEKMELNRRKKEAAKSKKSFRYFKVVSRYSY